MNIHWDALLAVVAVSSVSTGAVVVLVTLALLGLSARAADPVTATAATAGRRPFSSPAAGTAAAAVCLIATAAIVLFGLWVMVAR